MRRVLLFVMLAGMCTTAGCVGYLGTESGDGEPADAVAGELQIHHIDVGQADATLLVAPGGETMVIDSGDWRDDGQQVLDYLDSHGIDRIDHLVSTHGHADHIGGHERLIEVYETRRDGIGAVYDSGVAHTSQTYENYLDAVERHEVDLFELQGGDSVPFGDAVETTVLNPPAGGSGTDLHDNSVVLSVGFGEFQYLTTGDAEEDVEQRLIEDWPSELDSTLYQAGHHGSSTSSSPPLLAETTPEIAVISSARESQYGHPHDEVLQRFGERDIETYWTAVHGDIVVRSNGENSSVETEHAATTDPVDLFDLKNAAATRMDVHSMTRRLIHP